MALSALLAMLLLAPGAAADPPEITVTIFGTLGSNGWYRSNVTVNWAVTGAENSVGCDARTLTVDTLGTKLTCSATSGGDETIKSVTIKLDKTAPEAAAAPERPPDANSWYNRRITVGFSGTDVTSGLASCDGAKSYSGPDASSVSIEGACRDLAGNVAPRSVVLKYDATAPQAIASPARPPDANGWYNRPVMVGFSGTDATSGLAGCSSRDYGGPDNANALAVGSCSDNAGNTASATLAFKYDGTAPSLRSVTAKHGNRSARIAWRKSSDTLLVEVERTPGRNGQGETVVYRGSAASFLDTGLVVGRKYEYRVAGVDEAANRAEHKLGLVATGALLSPTPGQRLTSPPRLLWTPVTRANYFNVQLFFRGRKVFSAWPTRPSLRLPGTWVYRGRRHRLRPGVYRWYVWPGFGRIAAADYGPRLGSSTFVVSA